MKRVYIPVKHSPKLANISTIISSLACRSTIGQLLIVYQPTVGLVLVNSQARVRRWPTDVNYPPSISEHPLILYQYDRDVLMLFYWPSTDKWSSNNRHINQCNNRGILQENLIFHWYSGPSIQYRPTNISVDIFNISINVWWTDKLGKVSGKCWWSVSILLTISADLYIGRYIDQVLIMTLVASQSSIGWVLIN